jgi:acyl-CoA dehydrogenase
MRRYYQQLTRFSAAFAFCPTCRCWSWAAASSAARSSARLGDILAQMYLISCTLKRYEPKAAAEDAPLRTGRSGMPCTRRSRPSTASSPTSRCAHRPPSCRSSFRWAILGRAVGPVGHQVAKLLIEPSATRDRLTAECFLPLVESEPVGASNWRSRPPRGRADRGQDSRRRKGGVSTTTAGQRARYRHRGFEAGVISAAEYEIMKRRNHLRDIVVHVDDFRSTTTSPPPTSRRSSAWPPEDEA